MSITKKITVAAALLGLAASSAFADSTGVADTAGKMVFKARAGYSNNHVKSNYTVAQGANNVKLTNGYAGELAMGYFFTDNIATEASIGYSHAKLTSATNSKKTFRDVPLTALVQYHVMPEAAFSPYVGAGYAYHMIGYTNVKNAGAFVAQLGTDIAFNDTMGFNIDVKHAFKASHKIKNTSNKLKLSSTSVMAGVNFPL